jgi:hypothetical protein
MKRALQNASSDPITGDSQPPFLWQEPLFACYPQYRALCLHRHVPMTYSYGSLKAEDGRVYVYIRPFVIRAEE